MHKTKGPDFYDQAAVFEQYVQHRAKPDNPNKVIEWPIIAALIGDPIGMDSLDLGCGYGDMGQYLVDRGVKSYTGIDPSTKMIEAARKRTSAAGVIFETASVESFNWTMNSYDLVMARLVFHYVEDLRMIISKIEQALKTNGVLIFSVEHPVMTAMMGKQASQNKKEGWKVAQYFETGPRDHQWMGGTVIKYHRTIATYFQLLTRAGFRVTHLREGEPKAIHFQERSEYERRKNLPRYLIFRAALDE